MKRLLTALVAIAAAACNNPTASNTSTYDALPADQVLVGVTHNMTVAGVRSAKLIADTSFMFNDSATVQLRNVNLELYDENGGLKATLTSKTGSLDQRTRKMIARGDVVLKVQGANGRTVWTEELNYDPQNHQVWSEKKTRTRMANGSESGGAGFRSDDQFRNFSIDRPTGSIKVTF